MNVNMKRSVLASIIVLTMIIMVLPLAYNSAADPLDTSVTGTVAYSPSGTQIPFSGATVIAINLTDDSVTDQTLSAADGSFTLHLPNGSYFITAYAEGYNASNPHPNLTVDGESSINLNSLSGRGPLLLQKVFSNVNGTVKSNGTPLANASVSIIHDNVTLNSTITNATGFYNLNVQSGNHTLIVNADGYSQYSAAVNAPESQNITVHVDMTPLSSYSLQGTVAIAQGPLPNAQVSLSRVSALPGIQTVLTQSTNSNGVFLFPSVLEGDYTVHVSRDGYSEFLNVYANLTITGDTVLQYPIIMREAFGSISGTVSNGTFMISNAQVTLLDSDGDVYGKPARTDGDGFYQFVDIPTGTYTLVVVRNGYETMQTLVVIAPSENTVANFDLPNIERNYLFGLDMPHSMMLIGVFLASCLLVIAVGFRLQVGETPEMLYLKSLEEEEEEVSDV